MEYDRQVKAAKLLDKNADVILKIVAACKPREFDTPEEVVAAIEKYDKAGVESWLASSDCWIHRVPRGSARNPVIVTLAVRDAPSGAWSPVVHVPSGLQGYVVNHTAPALQNYMYRVNGNDKLRFQKDEWAKDENGNEVVIKTLEFASLTTDPAQVTSVLKPATKRVSYKKR